MSILEQNKPEYYMWCVDSSKTPLKLRSLRSILLPLEVTKVEQKLWFARLQRKFFLPILFLLQVWTWFNFTKEFALTNMLVKCWTCIFNSVIHSKAIRKNTVEIINRSKNVAAIAKYGTRKMIVSLFLNKFRRTRNSLANLFVHF